MDRRIKCLDFINGLAATAGAAMMPWHLLGEAKLPETSGDYYPPALTGLRGSHPGLFKNAHSLRDGRFWRSAESPKTPNCSAEFDSTFLFS